MTITYREKFIHDCLQVVHTIPGLRHKEVLKLKKAIVTRLVDEPPSFGEDILAQFRSDIHVKPGSAARRDQAACPQTTRAVSQLFTGCHRCSSGANRLAAMAPAAGHLVHMPAHVYIRTGDYAAAVKTNQEAAAVDRAYIKASGAQGIYPLMYYSHNLHFIAMCAAMSGDYAEANRNADLLAAHVAPHVKDMPPLEGFMNIPIAVAVRFHRWDDILKMPQARSRDEDHDSVLAFRARHGPGGQR